ncbi:MAG TPA: hypothetical protein VFO86_01005, partial [Terriglobia bacterium]|nr:hypothetical protein [Terriglobia bacterium]
HAEGLRTSFKLNNAQHAAPRCSGSVPKGDSSDRPVRVLSSSTVHGETLLIVSSQLIFRQRTVGNKLMQE